MRGMWGLKGAGLWPSCRRGGGRNLDLGGVRSWNLTSQGTSPEEGCFIRGGRKEGSLI